MDKRDEQLIEEKFKGIYSLFAEKFKYISDNIDDLKVLVTATNGKVKKLELNKELNSVQHKDITDTLREVTSTLKDISDKASKLEKDQSETDVVLKKVSNRIDNAKAIRTLNSLMQKPFLFISIIIFIVAIIDALVDKAGLADFLVKLIFKY